MKKSLLIIVAIIWTIPSYAQLITNRTGDRLSVAFDIYTDIPTADDDIDFRTINQGFSTSLSYNFPLGTSKHQFAIGAGFRMHNLYSDSRIANIHADTIQFVPIETNYKRSKINLVYLDFPAEFKFRFNNKMKLGIGFKLGVYLDSKEKFVGKESSDGSTAYVKRRKIHSIEKYSYGPTFRFGWNWISAYVFYQPSRIFERDLGPEICPITVGITLSPF